MVLIRASNSIENIEDSGIPADWKNRALFSNKEGADFWIASESEYLADTLGNENFENDLKELSKAVAYINPTTFISLGPGDGIKDKYIVEQSRSIENYVPVDINRLFIDRSISLLSKIVSIPLAFQADFEDDVDFIFQKTSGLKGPKVFSLLGNTLGNLDQYETKFLNQISEKLIDGDYLLIEVGILKGEWDFDRDISSSFVYQDTTFRHFLVNNIIQHTKEKREEVFTEFENRVFIRREPYRGMGDQSFDIFDKETGSQLLRLTRYNWSTLNEWFSNSKLALEVYYTHEHFYRQLNLGTGIVVLKRKSVPSLAED